MDASAVASEPFHSIQATDKVPEPIVKPKITSRVDNLAWVFSDQVGLRQRCCKSLTLGHCIFIMTELAFQGPLVLWTRFAGPCAGSGNKQDALRAENLARLLAQQKNADIFLIVEGSERSQVWNLQAVRECTKTLLQTTHQWCHYETV